MDNNATALVKRLHESRLAAFLPWIVCSLAASFYFYELCLRVALGTMVPEVQAALKVSMGQVGIISAFYYYAYTPMQIAAGALIDRIGPRKLLINMVLLCALGAIFFALTNSFMLAALAQFCVGFGSAFAFVGVLKLASNWLPIRYFSLISGLTTSLGMIGAMLSNILIAYLMRDMSWREVWCIFGGFGFLLMAIIYLMCVNKPADKTQTTTQAAQPWQEIKDDFFLMIQKPFFWVNALIGGLLYFPTTSFASLWGIPYISIAYHVDKIEASTVVSMIFLGWAVGGPIAGWLAARLVTKRTLLMLGSFFSLLLMILALLPLHYSLGVLGTILFLFGVTSSVQVVVFEIAAKLFKGRSAGTVASMTNFLVMFVCMVLQPITGLLLKHQNSAHDYRTALVIIPVGLLITWLMSLFLYREKVKDL